jgi:hypothetical protein
MGSFFYAKDPASNLFYRREDRKAEKIEIPILYFEAYPLPFSFS